MKAGIELRDGGLGLTLRDALNISESGGVTSAGLGIPGLKLRFKHSTGAISGEFTHPGSTKRTKLKGVILDGEASASGFFLSDGLGGAFSLMPR